MEDPTSKLIYWLTGVAGTGKTTVAQSVAAMAEEDHCLAATFFFSRTSDAADRRRPAAVTPTIAYQLAYKHNTLRKQICHAISSDRDIRERTITTQAKTLLSDALATVVHSFPQPLLVILDALDECDKENGREGGDLIPVLLDALARLPFEVKLFVTSRPEASISNLFSRANVRESIRGLALHRDIEQEIVRDDIGRYLRHELDKIADERSIPSPFPSNDDFHTLLDRAGTLFVYVRTVVKYVSSEVGNPVDQLADLLHSDSTKASEQFADLDVLYTQILAKALDSFGRSPIARKQFHDIIAILILLQENVPVTTLAILAGVSEHECKKALRCLSSLLLYDHQLHEPVRVMHPSFLDFITDPSRCLDSEETVCASEYHPRIVESCLQILNKGLGQNICQIQDPSLLNSEITCLEQRLAAEAPPQLRYAARFWHTHLIETIHVLAEAAELPPSLDEFCCKHLLHWLELMSLLGEFSAVQHGVPSLLALLQVILCFILSYRCYDTTSTEHEAIL
jgi:hypothetical protein